LDFGMEQPPRGSYANLPLYIPYMTHLSIEIGQKVRHKARLVVRGFS
jgi:hypothetical protein